MLHKDKRQVTLDQHLPRMESMRSTVFAVQNSHDPGLHMD